MTEDTALFTGHAGTTASLKDLLAERYGTDTPPDVVESAIVSHLLSHRSVRAYSNRPLPDFAVETMVAAAQSASSSSNLQAWSVVAVTDPERKAELSALAGHQRHIVDAPLQMVWLADLARLRTACEIQGIAADGLDYFELFLIGCIDAALASQNAALAAEAMNLGVVYIGGMRNHPQEVARLLGLPKGVFAVFGMCVGYPEESRPAAMKPRLSQDAVLFRETYSPQEGSRCLADYDVVMERFYASQKMDRPAWSKHSARRVSGESHLSGRHKLKAIVKDMGFALK